MTQGERKNYLGQKQGRQLINSESLVHPFPIESKERSKEIESETERRRAQEGLSKPFTRACARPSLQCLRYPRCLAYQGSSRFLKKVRRVEPSRSGWETDLRRPLRARREKGTASQWR